MADVQFPNESERKAFLEKLGQFRSTLPQSEQRMLDAMAVAAFCERPAGDVQGYGAATLAELAASSENPWLIRYALLLTKGATGATPD